MGAVLGKHDISMQILGLHAIPSKYNFNLTPNPIGGWLVNMIFLCKSGHFLKFQAKNFVNWLPTLQTHSTPIPWGGEL